MGKHTGAPDPGEKPTTEYGVPYGELSPRERADEFDKSWDDPALYAQRNFPARKSGTPPPPAPGNVTGRVQ